MAEREAPLAYEVAHRTIRRLLNEGCLIISDHAWEQMKRRQIDDQDIWKVLTSGSVTGHRWEENSCRYQIEGDDMEGLKTLCSVVIEDDAILVTVI